VFPSNFLLSMGLIRALLFSFSGNSSLPAKDNPCMTAEQSYRLIISLLFGNLGGFRVKDVVRLFNFFKKRSVSRSCSSLYYAVQLSIGLNPEVSS